jgi:hypothetical protein
VQCICIKKVEHNAILLQQHVIKLHPNTYFKEKGLDDVRVGKLKKKKSIKRYIFFCFGIYLK